MEQKYINHKGSHVLCDFIDVKGNEYILGNFIFNLMVKAINRTQMNIVHKHLEILNEDTPCGFTSVLLLDSSHFTCHSYSELGLLSLDIFTCGPTNVIEVMEYFRDELIKKYPDCTCTYLKLKKRFRY